LLSRTAAKQRWISFEDNKLTDKLFGIKPLKFADIMENREQVQRLVEKLQLVLTLRSKHGLYEMLEANEGVLNDVPKEYICPITLKVMEDPVLASDGHSYERKAIERWLRANNRSPKTNAIMASKTVYPNHGLKSMIEALVEKKLNENLEKDT
jgi:hypothetical protein